MMKKLINYEGINYNYFIYSDGRVFSIKSNKFLALNQNYDNDYLHVTLYNNGQKKQIYVHRLVASAFIPNPKKLPDVNHKDGNKTHNFVSNLEWVTKSENVIHAFKNNLKTAKKGVLSHLAVYDEESIKTVCKLLSEGILTLKEISKFTNVSFGMVYAIATHKSWTDISSDYNIDNYYHDRQSYSIEQYESVFKLLEENKLSLYDISDITSIKYSSICNILAKKSNPFYNCLFQKYNIDNYSSKNKKYTKEIPHNIISEINRLKSKNIKNKYIKRILANEYNINEEAIRVFIRDHCK